MNHAGEHRTVVYILEPLFSFGGFTMLIQTAVNVIIHYLMKVMMNYVLSFITWITATITGWDILVPFTIYGDKKI